MRQRAGQRGQVLPLVALCVGALMGFGGIAVDVGFLEYRQQSQQTATDAAALAGAQQLVRSGCGVTQPAITAADADAASNGFADGGSVSVSVQNPPAAGPYSGNACAVLVKITAHHVSTYFSRLFGYSDGMDESTQAVGTVSNNDNACVYLLSPTTTAIFNNDTVYAPGCFIAIEDTANFNGGTITAAGIGYAGGNPTENGTTFAQATPAPMLPVANPCPEIPGCAYLAANPPSTSGCSGYSENGQTTSIYPGCYSSFNLNGGNVTLNPGTYVFTGSMIFNNTKIQGSGVTVYVASGGTAPNFNGQTVSLTPPSSGNTAGVLYYQVPSNTSNPNFNGSGVQVSGLIYAPSANGVIFNGSNGNYVVLVFGSANWNGGSTYDFASPPPNGSLVKSAVLAQ